MKLQALDLKTEDLPDDIGDIHSEPIGFWKRQFLRTTTRKQKVFDWSYGVVLPLVCVAADPIIFAGSRGGIFGTYRPFAYLLSAVSIMAMAAWLLWGDRLRWIAAPIAGLFIVGSSVSFLVGMLLFPFSVLALLMIVGYGFLGFTPLLSALVYLRNGVRAIRVSDAHLERRVVWQGAVLAGLLALVIPYLVNAQISKSINALAKGDVNTIRREAAKLRYVKPLVSLEPIVYEYYTDKRGAAQERELVRVYKEFTGEDLDHTVAD